jgi:hypothetical protein
MEAKIRTRFGQGWRLAGIIFLITIAAGVVVKPSVAKAQPVEYVKICQTYSSGYYFDPGTDVCVDPDINDAREQTAGGTWGWRTPNNPRTWASTPQAACLGGQLVPFGSITSSGLTQNAYSRYETAHVPLKLKSGQYIASVIYKGGFTGVGTGNFCMFYYYNDPTNGPSYTALGCIDTAAQANVPASLTFTPDTPIPPIPPATTDQIYLLGANGEYWDAASAADIQGTLSVWLCLQHASGVTPGQ